MSFDRPITPAEEAKLDAFEAWSREQVRNARKGTMLAEVEKSPDPEPEPEEDYRWSGVRFLRESDEMVVGEVWRTPSMDGGKDAWRARGANHLFEVFATKSAAMSAVERSFGQKAENHYYKAASLGNFISGPYDDYRNIGPHLMNPQASRLHSALATDLGQPVPPTSRKELAKRIVGSFLVLLGLAVAINALQPAPAPTIERSTYDAPMVWPNAGGRMHVHQFYGNEASGNFYYKGTVTDQILQECSRDDRELCKEGEAVNRSGYWSPVMVQHMPPSTLHADWVNGR